jgi:hypothetical protein
MVCRLGIMTVRACIGALVILGLLIAGRVGHNYANRPQRAARFHAVNRVDHVSRAIQSTNALTDEEQTRSP